MRVIGGKYRGKQIMAKKEKTLRPTTSFIRETIFNILKHGKFFAHEDYIEDDNPDRVEGRRVLDVFCGTGALGIEAISRGAEHVTFIDQNANTMTLARQNVENIGEISNTRFIRSDSTNLPPTTQPCDLIFLDPPYRQNLAKKSMLSMADSGWVSSGAIIILEAAKTDDPPEVKGYNMLDDRIKDKKRISIYQFTG